MRRRRFVAAVLHLVLGSFLPPVDAGPAPGPDDDTVVDVVIETQDADTTSHSGRHGARFTAATVDALAAADVDLAVIRADPQLSQSVVRDMLREALLACRAAGTLKVIVESSEPLSADIIRQLAEPLGFHYAGIARDHTVVLYRDIYTRPLAKPHS